jgi:hypothetical protein
MAGLDYIVVALLYCSTAVAAWLLSVLAAVRPGASRWVASLVFGSGLIIVESTALSRFEQWTAAWLCGVSLAVLTIITIVFRRRLCRNLRRSHGSIRRAARRAADLSPLAIGVLAITAFVFAINFWVGLKIAPNNWDSMTYHLSRIAYWMQQQRIGDFDGQTLRQAGSLPNGEILQAWFMLPLQSDRFAFAPQWLALVGIGLAAYLGARLVTRNRSAAVLAGCAVCLLPQPILQSTSTQNDLICAFFVLGGTVFALRGITRQHRGDILVGALALAVAIGTKGTAWFAVPALVIAATYLIWIRGKPLGAVVRLALWTVAFTVIVDGAWFALNVLNGRPLDGGLSGATSTFSGAAGPNPDYLANAQADLIRTLDFSGLPPEVSTLLFRALNQLAYVQAGMNIRPYPMEDLSAFGIAGLTLIPLVMLYGLLRGRVNASARVFALTSAISLAIFVVTVAANPWTARLMIFIVALAAPLFAFAFHRWWIAIPALIVVMIPGYQAFAHNANKELLNPAATLPLGQADRIVQMTQQRGELTGPLYALDQLAAPDARIGYVGGEDDWDYPVFGPHFRRHVTRIPPADATTLRLQKPGLDGTFWAFDGSPPPRGSQAIPLGGKYYWVPNQAN